MDSSKMSISILLIVSIIVSLFAPPRLHIGQISVEKESSLQLNRIHTRGPGGASIYNVHVWNCTFNGTSIFIDNQSTVLIENVTFEGYPTTIFVSDNAYLLIRDFRVNLSQLLINASGNAEVVIDSEGRLVDNLVIFVSEYAHVYIYGPISYMYINATDYGSVYVEANISSSNMDASGESTLYLSSCYISNLHINLYDNATISAYDCGGSIGMTDIYLYDTSCANLSRSAFYGYIYAYNNSVIGATSSTFDAIYVSDSSNLVAFNSNISSIEAFSESIITISGCNVSYLYMGMYSEHEPSTPGPSGQISNSSIETIYTYSGNILYLYDTYVQELYYSDVHNGSLTIEDSSIWSSSSYPNYQASGGYIAYLNTTDIIIAVGATYVEVNGSASLNVYEVETVELINGEVDIYSIRSNITACGLNSSGVSMNLYSSNVYIGNADLGYLDINGFNSMVILNSSVVYYPYIWVEDGSSLFIVNSTLESPYMYMENCSLLNVSHSYMFSTDRIELHKTHGYFYSSYISNSSSTDLIIYVDESPLELYYVNATGNIYTNYILVGGLFIIIDNVLVNYTGNLVSGVFSAYSYIEGDIYLDSIVLVNASCEYKESTILPLYPEIEYYVEFYINSSELYLNATVDPYVHIDIYSEGYSQIHIINIINIGDITMEDGEIDLLNSTAQQIYAYSGQFNILDSNIGIISVFNGTILLYNSHADNVKLVHGFVNVTLSNIFYSLQLGDIEDLLQHGLSTVDAYVKLSNVSIIEALGLGDIYVENSEIYERIFYVFHNVTIVGSIVYSVLNNYLYTSGSVTIDNNVLPSGYINLLYYDASSSIGRIVDCIVGHDVGTLSLSIINSSYFLVFSFGGDVYISNSEFVMMFLLANDGIILENSTVNGSVIEEPPPTLITGSDVDISFCLFISNGLFMMAQNHLSIDHINATNGVYIANSSAYAQYVSFTNGTLMIANSTMYLEYALLNGTDLHVYNSSISIQYVFLHSLVLMNSTANLSNVNIAENETSMVYLIGQSYLYGYSILAQSVGIGGMTYMYYSCSPYAPSRYISWDLVDSIILKSYAKYYHVNSAVGASFVDDVATGDYILLSRYTSTDLSTATLNHVQFDIVGYGRANITGYVDKLIVAMWISTIADLTPPVISLINVTSYTFELGLESYVKFSITDTTPSHYIININGSEVERNSYTSGQVISTNIASYIASAGTYIIDIVAYDLFGNSATANATIHVLPAEAPNIILSPNDNYTLDIGDVVLLNWSAEDYSPHVYYIYVNESLVEADSWGSGDLISYEFVANATGTFNVTIAFYDELGLVSVDTIFIYVAQPTTATTKTGGGIATPKTIALIGTVIVVIFISAMLLLRRKG